MRRETFAQTGVNNNSFVIVPCAAGLCTRDAVSVTQLSVTLAAILRSAKPLFARRGTYSVIHHLRHDTASFQPLIRAIDVEDSASAVASLSQQPVQLVELRRQCASDKSRYKSTAFSLRCTYAFAVAAPTAAAVAACFMSSVLILLVGCARGRIEFNATTCRPVIIAVNDHSASSYSSYCRV